MNNNFEQTNLSETMQENLHRLGYKSLTTIQEKVIPIALSGKDLIGQSRTGTGKTAAFLIPIIESLRSEGGQVEALILAPTRELALQIKEEALKLSKGTNLSVLAVYGGESIENQIYQLKRKAEIVVGTPGRVLDHLKRRTMRLDSLKFFVLDEVDEMLKRGFIDDIRTIAELARSDRLQTLFFSATISQETKALSDNFLRSPVFINNSLQKDETIKPLISQYYLGIRDVRSRIPNLLDIIHFQNPELAIIFAGTKRMVDVISDELIAEGFSVDKIHSDLSQSKRTSVYNNFKSKKIQFLVATDIAARGIDIDGISHVYNFDFPQDPEFYIHRIGRTGRAGMTGESIILLNDWEIRRQLPFLERLTGEKIKPIFRPSPEELNEIIETKALTKIKKKIEDAKDQVVSEKTLEALQEYTPEQIVKGFVSSFIVKRKRHSETKRQETYENNSRRTHNRGFGESNYRSRRTSENYNSRGDSYDREKRPHNSRRRDFR